MSEPTFEELMGLPPKEKRRAALQALAAPTSEQPSYNDLMGIEEGAPEAKLQGKTAEDFRTPEYLANKAKLGMASLLSLGGIPLDFINELQYMGYDMFGIDVHNKFLDTTRKPLPYGFEQQKKAYEAILFGDFDIQEPEDVFTRALGTTAEFGGGGLIPGGALVGRAGSITPKTAPFIQKLTNTVIPKASVAATEAASAVAGGFGTEFAGELAKDTSMEPTARMLGGLFGSMAPYSLPATLTPIYSRIRNWLSPATQSRIGRQTAANLIKKELANVPDAMDKLAEGERLRKNIPGYSPSLGTETDAAGILSLEKRFAQNSVRGYELSRQAELDSVRAIKNRLDEAFPQSNFNLSTVPEERLTGLRTTIKGEIKALDDQMKALESRILAGRAESPAKIGVQLRALRESKEQAAREVKNTLYEQFYRAADDANMTVNPQDIRDVAAKVLGDEGLTFQKKSPVMQKILARYFNLSPDDIADGQTLSQALANRGPQAPANALVDSLGNPLPLSDDLISMREFHSMYKEINRELGLARRGMQRGDTQAGALYFQLRQMKNEFAKNLDVLKESQFGVVADKLREADNYYLNDYQKVFREGLGGRIDNYNRFGDVTPDEDIVSKLVMGRESGMDDFYRLYGESEEAQALLENGVLDMFARAAIKRGKYDPTAAANFLDKHDDVLRRMPDMRQLLNNQEKAYQAMLNRNAQLSSKLKAIKRGKLQQLTGMHNSEEVINRAMGDQDRLLSLRRTVERSGDPEAMAAFRSGIADHLMKQTDPFEYFLENESKMRIAFKNSRHFQDLRDLSQARRILSNKFPVQQVDTTLVAEDPLKKLIGTSSVEAMTMARWVQASRLSPEYVISQMTSRGVLKFRQEAMNRAMEEALYDPSTARTLLEFAETQGKIKPLSARPGSWGKSDFAEKLKEIFFSVGIRNTAVNANAMDAPKDDLFEE